MSTTNNIHEGRNVKRFREMRGMKQEALAIALGHDWTQKRISLLEQKETIALPILQQVSAALEIPVEAFQELAEDQAVNIIANTFGDHACVGNPNSTFNINPIEEIKQLHEQKIAIYERMLKEKDDMMAKLEKLLERK